MTSGPPITNKQMASAASGNVSSSVNLFRGTVTFPLQLLQLSGRSGLPLAITAMYVGNVTREVALSNDVAPTGLLGLGWSLGFDQVTAQSDGAAGPYDTSYSLTAGGQGGALVPIKGVRRAGHPAVYEFALADYQFWRILYIPEDERWEVTQSDGVTYVYGSASRPAGGVQWGLRHGAWTGASSAGNAERYAVAWNLIETRNRWGDRITYRYDNDEVAPDGSAHGRGSYTRASYLASIVDSCGRTISLEYGDKVYEPAQGVYEYRPPHVDELGQAVPAYHDRYQTRYLRSIAVSTPAGDPDFSLHLGYQVSAAASGASDALAGSRIKRYLTEVSRIEASGISGQVASFRYEQRPSSPAAPCAAGTLISVVHPGGGVATYTHEHQILASAQTAHTVELDGAPGVWFGPDFVVVTAQSSGSLGVAAYAWGGTWLPWSDASSIESSIADGTLVVVTGDDWFAVTFTDEDGASDHVHLYRRDPGRLGSWTSTSYSEARSDGTTTTLIAAGTSHVALGNAAFTDAPVIVYSLASGSGWQRDALSVAGSGPVALAGRGAYFATCRYDDAAQTGSFQLYTYDPLTCAIGRRSGWTTSMTIEIAPADADAPLWNLSLLSPGEAFLAATYITAADAQAGTQTIEVVAFDWSSDYQVNDADGSLRVQQTVDFTAELPVMITIAAGDQLGNCGWSARYDGARWWTQEVSSDGGGDGAPAFAYGGDLLLSSAPGRRDSARFDTASGTWENGGLAPPTSSSQDAPPAAIGGRTAVVGKSVYGFDVHGAWTRIGDLPSSTSEASVRLCGDGVIAFEEGTGSGARSRIARVTDAGLVYRGGDQSSLAGQRCTVDGDEGRGSSLCGPGVIVTYPAEDDFSNARTLILHRLVGPVVDAPLTAFAVTRVAVDDGYRSSPTSFWYDTLTATYDAEGHVPQYSSVWSFPGAGTTPADAVYGATEYRYYNGLAPAAPGTFYPTPEARHNYSRLSGTLIYQRGHRSDPDAGLLPVTLDLSCTSVLDGPAGCAWSRIGQQLAMADVACAFQVQVATDSSVIAALDDGQVPSAISDAFTDAGYTLGAPLVVIGEEASRRWLVVDEGAGAVYELVLRAGGMTLDVLAGTSQVTRYSYDHASGQVATVTSHQALLDGSTQVVTRAMTYGHQIYDAMKASNLLGTLVQLTTTSGGVVTSSRGTTWRDWSADARGCWGPEAFYAARVPGATFDPTAVDPTSWALRAQVISRDAHGQVLERVKADGMPRTTVYDAAGQHPIASFVNGSGAAGEVLYAGFQPYEDLSAWTVDGVALDCGGSMMTAGDAHTGVQSLRLGAGSTLARALTSTPRQSRYAVSFWAKTAAGFDADGGSAALTLTATSGVATVGTLRVAITDTDGCWRHHTGTLALDAAPGAALAFAFALANAKTSASLQLGEILFAPELAQATAQVYAPGTGNTTATVQRTGLTSYTTFDERGRKSSSSAHDRQPLSTLATTTSRRARGDGVDPASPSSTLSLRAGNGGVFETFGDGEEWRRRWSQPASGWSNAGGVLRHTAGTTDTITLRDGAAVGRRTAIAVQASVRPTAFLTAPITLAVGQVAASWLPGAGPDDPGGWSLTSDGAATGPLVIPAAECVLPAAWTDALAGATVSPALADALAARGIPLPAAAPITQVTAGVTWRIDDTVRAQRYALTLEGDVLAVSRLTLAPAVWMLIVAQGAALFFAGGRQVAGALCTSDPASAPALTAHDAVDLGFLAVLVDPTTALGCTTGTGVPLQAQTVDGTTTIVRQTLIDALGRPIGVTKPVAFASTLPGYRAGFVTAVDPDDGSLTGEVADYYAGQDGRSDDGGYPYSSIALERAPTARVIEQGSAGQAFAIDPSNPQRHTVRTSYGGSGVELGLRAGAFTLSTTVDANGNTSIAIKDGRGVLVQSREALPGGGWRIASCATTHDASGTTLTQRPPAGYAPPAGSTAEDWDVVQSSDLLGNVTSLSMPDRGQCTRLYDSAGRLRAQQDALGRAASTPYVQYWRYDAVGRMSESGVTDATWAQAQSGVADASWPDEPRTWRVRFTYGSDLGDPTSFGRLIELDCNNGDAGTADVIEAFTYDLAGNVVTSSQRVLTADGVTYTTGYQRDPLGRIRRLQYPDGTTTVAYSYDGYDHITAVGRDLQDPDAYASYTYDAAGALIGEVLRPGSAGEVTRTRTYASPGWPLSISDPLTTETLSYTEGGAGGAAYYDGSIAGVSSALRWEGAPAAVDEDFAYDQAGWLTTAGGAEPDGWSYDGNGNITALGGAACTYTPATNQLVRMPGSTSDDFAYDAGGNLTTSSPRGLSSITYDPGTAMTRSIAFERGDDAGTIAYTYGAGQRRVLKTISARSGSTSKLYVRATNGMPLLERWSGAGKDGNRALIYGPRGLVAAESSAGSRSVLLDHLGSVIAVTDAQGTAVAGFQYSPFGAVTSWGDAGAVDYRFTGQELDGETGLYNFNLRLYDPAIGRFYAPDPRAQYASPYTYVGNDPLRKVDPTGGFGLLLDLMVDAAVAITETVVAVFTGGAALPEELALDAGLLELEVDEAVTSDALEAIGLGGREIGLSFAELNAAEAEAEVVSDGVSADLGEMSEAVSLEPTEDLSAPTGGDDEAGAGEPSGTSGGPAEVTGEPEKPGFWRSAWQASHELFGQMHGYVEVEEPLTLGEVLDTPRQLAAAVVDVPKQAVINAAAPLVEAAVETSTQVATVVGEQLAAGAARVVEVGTVAVQAGVAATKRIYYLTFATVVVMGMTSVAWTVNTIF